MDDKTIQTPAQPQPQPQSTLTEQPSLDMLHKMLFSEKVILARILKECVPEYRNVPLKAIRDKYIEPKVFVHEKPIDREYASAITGSDKEDSGGNEGTVYFDVLFSALLPGSKKRCGIIINIEIQSDYNPGYPLIKRGVYYCARLLSRQKGRTFKKSNYKCLEKVYSIWICVDPPKKRKNTVNFYHMAEDNWIGSYHEKKADYDLLNVIMINLGPMDLKRKNDIVKYLSIVVNTRLTGKEKVHFMKEHFQEEWPESAERSADEMYTLEDKVRDEGRKEGLKEGRKEGRKKGKAEGKIEALIDAIKNVMNTFECSLEKAMDSLCIPLDQRGMYRAAVLGN